MVEGDQDAHQVHQDPQEVQDVMPIWALQVNNFEDEAHIGHDKGKLKILVIKPGQVDRKVPLADG